MTKSVKLFAAALTFSIGVMSPSYAFAADVYTVSTFAGTGTLGQGGDNADATQSTLSYPYNVAVDTQGNVYIADTSNYQIQKVALDTIDPTVNTTDLGTIVIGDTTTVDYNCLDIDGSGIDTCSTTLEGDSVNVGDTLDTSRRGTQTLIVTAHDNAGNTTTQTMTITVNGERELTGDYKAAVGTNGSIARLYMAAFTRNPETTGFQFWEASQQAGASLQQMAGYFRASPEFVALYGSTTSTEFVDLMYQNVMLRTADTEGHAFWLAQLDAGVTQARVLLMLSESPEFKSLTYTS